MKDKQSIELVEIVEAVQEKSPGLLACIELANRNMLEVINLQAKLDAINHAREMKNVSNKRH